MIDNNIMNSVKAYKALSVVANVEQGELIKRLIKEKIKDDERKIKDDERKIKDDERKSDDFEKALAFAKYIRKLENMLLQAVYDEVKPLDFNGDIEEYHNWRDQTFEEIELDTLTSLRFDLDWEIEEFIDYDRNYRRVGGTNFIDD